MQSNRLTLSDRYFYFKEGLSIPNTKMLKDFTLEDALREYENGFTLTVNDGIHFCLSNEESLENEGKAIV